MKYLFAALFLVGCVAVAPTVEPIVLPGEYYPVVDNEWPAAKAFCERHIKAAKEKPEYLVDICIVECELNPTQPWCEDLKEILKNDEGRNSRVSN